MKHENMQLVRSLIGSRSTEAEPTHYQVHKAPESSADGKNPKVSIILLDWDCRESLHSLDWLLRQNVSKDDYEVIWIDLYDRVVPEAIEKADVVVTLEQKGMYHKHIGYNVGTLLARGDIITVCDSDAVFPEDFIQSILTSFTEPDRDELKPLVLMHHELRTSFTYPDDLTDAEELKDERIWKWWPLHPNAGACMSVRKDDALRFGGFDESPSYRGYLCGPYDLGWRLVNAGIPEVWHDTETVLWHFAHPDPIGSNGLIPSVTRLFENRFAHVDLHAITAVEHFSTGGVMPLVENPTIHRMRMDSRVIGSRFERKYAELNLPRGFSRRHLAVLQMHLYFDLVISAFLVHPLRAIMGGLRRSTSFPVRVAIFAITRFLIRPYQSIWGRLHHSNFPPIRSLRNIVRTLRGRNGVPAKPPTKVKPEFEMPRRPQKVELEVRTIPKVTPKVSFVLLDWSVRESFHFLDYLAEQNVPRDRYEVIWIEYFDRHVDELQQRMRTSSERGEPSPIDTYAILNTPDDVYYHKHLMYNVGIVLAHGETVCFCDSDAMVRPGFVDSIIKSFESNTDIVLHHDQVRNHSREFHPFRHPTFRDVIGPGCVNWLNGKTNGLWDEKDPIHARNYGASMTARRDDLIAIGGADMHSDYLGYVCGPYDMTFRLKNLGREEVWHQDEVLYHVWHPGEAGVGNYSGPHDGLEMSTTALEANQSQRTQPLVENEAIRMLREGELDPDNDGAIEELLTRAIDMSDLLDPDSWKLDANGMPTQSAEESSSESVSPDPQRTSLRLMSRWGRIRALAMVPWMLKRHLSIRLRSSSNDCLVFQAKPTEGRTGFWGSICALPRKIRTSLAMTKRMLKYESFLLKLCWRHLCHAEAQGCEEIVLYGDGDTARIVVGLSELLPVKVQSICPFEQSDAESCYGRDVWSKDQLADYQGTVLLTSVVNVEQRLSQLREMGIARERVITMQA
jgi:GT2 family glycosyltransferase